MSSRQRKTTKANAKSGNETTNEQVNLTISENESITNEPLNLVQSVLTETEEQREEREEAELRAGLERLAKAKAKRKAEAEIETLRTAKAETFKADAQRKRAEADRLLKEAEKAEAEAEAILKGERDQSITTAEAEKNGVVRVVVGGNAPKPQAEKKEGARERVMVKRKELSEVITRPTRFKTKIKDQVKEATTENGETINADGKTYESLNKWLDASVRAITGDNKTKKSVFEVVFYYNDTRKEWRKLGEDYTAETTTLN
jgi:hypothetical protein